MNRSALLMGLALPLAWAIDWRCGEPPHALHPVAWLGRVLGPIGRGLRRCRPVLAFVAGAVAWCVLAASLAAAAWAGQRTWLAWSPWVAVPLLALLLKPTFAWRMLRDEVAAVGSALDETGLDAARDRLARLVSRDVRGLDADGVRETAIETLAENLNDSVVAPLFWYAVAGLPGAAVYRFANTADAMWGRRGEWEWAGKWAARADDALSWLPARCTAALLLPPGSGTGGGRWRALRAEARLTPSPNGGWPMGAMALRLGVRLRKPGVYTLNAEAPSPTAGQVGEALRHASAAAWLAAGVATLIGFATAAWA